MKKKGKKQNLRDKDDEAEGSRSKDRPTAESFTAVLDEKKEKYWAEKRKKQNVIPCHTHIPPLKKLMKKKKLLSSLQWNSWMNLTMKKFGFETRADMVSMYDS